jgi:hypothetical protein
MGNKGRDNNRENIARVAGTAIVGITSLLMLGLSTLLAAILARYSIWLAGALPLAILVGAGFLTARIWFQGEKSDSPTETEILRERVKDLEERLANLEMIDSVEAHFANKQQAATPPSVKPGTGERPRQTAARG